MRSRETERGGEEVQALGEGHRFHFKAGPDYDGVGALKDGWEHIRSTPRRLRAPQTGNTGCWPELGCKSHAVKRIKTPSQLR